MAGHDDADRVLPVGQPHGAGRAGLAEVLRQFSVRTGLAVRNPPELGPDGALERGTGEVQRKVELPQLTGEVGVQLLDGLVEGAGVGLAEGLLGRPVALTGHIETGEDPVRGDEGQRAVGTVDHCVLPGRGGPAGGHGPACRGHEELPCAGRWLMGWSSTVHRYWTA